jgi:hypothetical protein
VNAAAAIAVAATFTWLGMVLGISFLEAPLKFRAPGVSLRVGLGIGRIVFRALNTVEVVLAALVLACVLVGGVSAGALVAMLVAIGVLVGQLVLVRPKLGRRASHVLAGSEGGSRSHAHYVYVALEVVKVAGLVVGGVLVLAAA